MDLREWSSTVTTRHPWESVRARFFSRMLANPARSRPLDVLDVGAGDGYVAEQLLDALPPGSAVTCVDSEYDDEHLAKRDRVTRSRTLPDREFDVIVMLDVLEHVENDRAFVCELIRRLRAGGRLLISVPAHQILFTQHDVALGHYRRYSQTGLREVLTACGLAPVMAGSLFGSLLAPRALSKLLERARGVRSARPAELATRISTGVNTWRHSRLVTRAVEGALELDARLCEVAARASLPSVGLSVWALCERSS